VVLELNQASIYTSWNGNFAGSGSRKSVTPVGWNASVDAGTTLQAFGYCANTTGANSAPVIISPLGNGGGGAGGAGGAGTGGSSGIGGGGAFAGGGSGGAFAGGGSGGAFAGGGSGGAFAGGGSGGAFAGGGSGGAFAGGGSGGAFAGGGSGGAFAGGGSGGSSGGSGSPGYTPTSEYLVDPNRAVGTLKALADFRAKSRDHKNGGFFSFVKADGTVGSDRRKGFVTTTRDAWAFSRAFMVTGDEIYLDHAAHALEHLFAHGWDNKNGGWYFTGDEFGNLTPYSGNWNPNTWKWSFVQHYALLGIGANCEASRDATTCAWLTKGRNLLDSKMWDSNPSQLGYYEQANLDMTGQSGKGFTATVDALTTNAIQTELLWPTTAYQQRTVELANIVTNRLAANLDLSIAKYGFPENYNANWSVITSQTGVDTGHILKSAWVLARVYLRHPDARYRTAARKLIYEVLNNGGWDEAAGVPYTTGNWSTGQVTKLAECWQIEQAITGGLSNWYIADNPADRQAFLKMADRSLLFFAKYVIDHANGGTFKMNNINGTPTDGVKSNFFNVEYHSTETFYFTYLYGNLMLHRAPVALYYKLTKDTVPRVIQLNPVAIDDASIRIQSVTLDGAPLTTFSASTREVTLAAGQGGKLRVVFGPAP
jgi:mannose/cellobiose epimerase-like protein (N-acyl-D-glucosamine 2-epimerase family)